MAIRRKGGQKNPPMLSHEFIIQNHADIVSCLAMIFIVGLMFQFSAPVASLFVAMQHNVTLEVEDEAEETPNLYTYGSKDLCAVFFYFLICIVIHAVIQEYILDKLNRKMHLSKIKHSKFNESGQLLSFYVISVIWGIDIILHEGYAQYIGVLWENYPHNLMSFSIKFFFIIQLAYWLHCFPELYFQKTKKEEMPAKIQYAVLYFVFLSAAYLLNFTRIGICLIVLHYIVEAVFHFSRLIYFSDKSEIANAGFMMWNFLFVLVRLGTITLSVLTFWYGLEQTGQATIDFQAGNFNTQIIRINCLAGIGLLQAWIMWNFITFHLRRVRERATVPPSLVKQKKELKKQKKSRKDRDDLELEEDELPEVDQNTQADEKHELRSRGGRGKKY